MLQTVEAAGQRPWSSVMVSAIDANTSTFISRAGLRQGRARSAKIGPIAAFPPFVVQAAASVAVVVQNALALEGVVIAAASHSADGMGGEKMSEFVVALLAFLSMMGAALPGLFGKTRLRSERVQDDTRSVILLVANLFVVMTSLVLGLMLNSAKNTFETNNRDIRTLATELILLDRTMRALGPEAEDARRHLVEYLQTSLKYANILEESPQAEASLEAAGTSLSAIRVSDEQKVALWSDARQLYRQVIRQRWVVIDEYGGTIPPLLITVVILSLAFIFASFGYRAPPNTIVTASFFLAALLISAALYLIVDMDRPFASLTRTSNVPFQRALQQLQR